MKTKVAILCCLACVVILFAGYQINMANAATPVRSEGLKIGFVSIRTVFEQCQSNVKHQQQAMAEREKLEAELNKIRAEIEAAEAGLKTLKPDSDEYISQAQQVLLL